MMDCDGTSPTAHLLRDGALTTRARADHVPGAFGLSLLVHVLAAIVLAVAVTRSSGNTPHTMSMWTSSEHIWLATLADLARGGGSGNQETEPARKMEEVGRDAVTMPAATGESPKETRRLDQNFRILAVSTAAGVDVLPGLPVSLVTSNSSGPGVGKQGGQGSGPGDGPGLGPGRGGGEGGDAYQPGGGVVGPRLIKETKPSYTADAMRAKIQGVVGLEAVVMPDGSVGRVRIVRSLDTTFGLDDEAVAAVKRWRFVPGTLAGRAVPVLVNIELSFTLR